MGKQKLTFKEAVLATPEVATCYQNGLQALGSYSVKVTVADRSGLSGSVELDKCVERLYPSENRWDYIVCYKEQVYFIEVHSAETGEVDVVLRKKRWLIDWMNDNAPEVKRLSANAPYYWIQSGRYNIPKHTPQYRRLAQAGLLPLRQLVLD